MSTPEPGWRDQFAAWAEKFEPKDFPTIPSPFAAPVYTLEFFTEPVEPYYTQYNALSWQHPYDKDCECREPDPEWYTPTPKLLELEARMDALRAKAFRKVPNPEYDAERAAAYWEQQRNRFNTTTIMTGQSYNPER